MTFQMKRNERISRNGMTRRTDSSNGLLKKAIQNTRYEKQRPPTVEMSDTEQIRALHRATIDSVITGAIADDELFKYLMLQMRDRFNDNMKERICGSFDRVFSSCSTPTSGVQEMNISEPETETEN